MDRNPQREDSFARTVVIDDDCDSLAFLTTLLKRHGIRCAAFGRSAEALEYIEHNPVSVVVTDIFMPEVDGVQLVAAIRKCRPEATVIALSGYNESYLRCMKMLGAAEGLSKPVNPSILVPAVERFLGGEVHRFPCPA